MNPQSWTPGNNLRTGTIIIPPSFLEAVVPELARTWHITAQESFRVGRILGSDGGNAAAYELTEILEEHERIKTKSTKK